VQVSNAPYVGLRVWLEGFRHDELALLVVVHREAFAD
jgi:hypothetical protein